MKERHCKQADVDVELGHLIDQIAAASKDLEGLPSEIKQSVDPAVATWVINLLTEVEHTWRSVVSCTTLYIFAM